MKNLNWMTWVKLFVWENLKFLLKEFQFVMSLKIRRSMTYTFCLNQWVEFYQTCMDTSLGQAKELIKFWWLWLKVTGGLRLLNFLCWHWRDRFMYPLYLLNQWNVTKLAWIYHWDELKSWLDFGDLDLIFKVTGGLKYMKISLKLIYLLNPCHDFYQTSIAIPLGQS